MTGSRTEEATAVLFDIQRLALDDGPGIRTNIFFKGCPLRCVWCHNPESYTMAPQLGYNPGQCVACGLCADVCAHTVHSFGFDGDLRIHRVAHQNCTGCGECMQVCCYGALSLAGRSYTVSALLDAISVDLPYYRLGEGGGVTLTGGEPMLQWRFVDAFLRRLEGVHAAIETSGYAPPEAFRAVLPRVDLFLFDYKATAPERHRQLCGTDNALILGNLDLVLRSGASVILRAPLVPSINDDEEHLKGVAEILNRYPSIEYVQIMPYHKLGDSKRRRFGMDSRRVEIPDTAEGQAALWRDKLYHYGVPRGRIR